MKILNLFFLGLMEKYELDPGAFGLELTESVYVESQDTMAEAVARLQKKASASCG